MRLTELKLYLCLEVTEQNINLECATVTEVLTFYCIPHVTLLKGQLCSPKETLMSLEFFCKLLLGKKELRGSCSEQFFRVTCMLPRENLKLNSSEMARNGSKTAKSEVNF